MTLCFLLSLPEGGRWKIVSKIIIKGIYYNRDFTGVASTFHRRILFDRREKEGRKTLFRDHSSLRAIPDPAFPFFFNHTPERSGRFQSRFATVSMAQTRG